MQGKNEVKYVAVSSPQAEGWRGVSNREHHRRGGFSQDCVFCDEPSPPLRGPPLRGRGTLFRRGAGNNSAPWGSGT